MDNYTRGILEKLHTACSRKLAITKIQYEQALAYHECVKNELLDDDEWRSDLEPNTEDSTKHLRVLF